ncbi:MAG TPA: hypothetical protein VIU40_06050 [Geobacteraceae bacterium]
MNDITYRSKRIISSFRNFIAVFGLVHLRPYQVEAAEAVIASILRNDGDTFVWKFARQGGKDETLAALCQYIMLLYSHRDISIVLAAPTFKPQLEIAMRRLSDRLSQNIVLRREWRRQLGYTFVLRRARTIFLSADPSANVVGATANPLLIINEAQDVRPDLFDRRFAPMAAAHNATRLFCGTSWTSGTLLAREEAGCLLREQTDAKRRLFIVDGPAIARVHLPYARFLEGELLRLGQDHPIYRTQYLCREIDAEAGMFTPARRAMMRCDCAPSPEPSSANRLQHPLTEREGVGVLPTPSLSDSSPLPRLGGGAGGGGLPVIFTLDVAGQDETAFHNPEQQMLRNPGRDSVSLTIASVDLSAIELLQAPIFRILAREQWTGLNHVHVFGKLTALADHWRPQHIIIDATGVGEGLWAMLDKRYATRVIPVKFSAQKKSELGYRFLAMIETGRLRDCAPSLEVDRQYAACISEVLLGPQRTMRWGVPEGTRDPDGNLVHDDILMADALLAEADQLDWRLRTPGFMIHPKDPLEEMSHFRREDL